jgi:hypothetical protein
VTVTPSKHSTPMTRTRNLAAAASVFTAVLATVPAAAQTAPGSSALSQTAVTTVAPAVAPGDLRARLAGTPPKIDGALDDEIWSAAPLQLDRWMSYNPLRGEPERQRTEVWIGYDRNAIYFAFRCHDPEPDRIRTTISRRDTVWNDDWVGVSLDSSRAGQVAYHMFVNPSGVQMDALQTTNEDTAPDWLWQSAGRIDKDGYTVEIRLPLESIRFKGGDDVRMNMLFYRRNSRLGLSWSWPEMKPGQWVFEAHQPVAFGELEQPLLLEVIPSAVLSRNQSRAPAGASAAAGGSSQAWGDARSKGDFGASVKYGVTSSVTLDATINPDFSQVESDAFEVEVNNRFPVFFSEKRPFFMEGMGLFNLAGTGNDGSMRTAVHTRRIVDPLAGLKLTGTAGRYTFAALSAPDASVDPAGDAHKFFTIGRGMYNIAPGQHVGVLLTDTEYRGDYNRVLAADIALRHGSRFRWNANMILTDSATPAGGSTTGQGGQVTYNWETRRYGFSGQVEHFSTDFRMDTAFVNRVGMTRTWQYAAVNFYPDQRKYPWIRRINPFVWVAAAEDRVQGGDELFVLPALRFNFTRQGALRVDYGTGHETFAGRRFETGRVMVDGGAQILRWLNVGANFNKGPGIFYDPRSPFQGRRHSTFVRATVQPNSRLNHNLSYNFQHFERADTGALVYDVHIINLRNTYQFNRQFLVRAITQWDSSRRRILGDFLGSYELVPGSVIHAGYGSLWERPGFEPYRATARAFFFKASYQARF